MGGKSLVLRPMQERNMRTKWTPALDKIFADLVVQQIQLGNRPNNAFDKKTWNLIRDEFNKQTDLNFNNNQLRKHLLVLQTRFLGIKSAVYANDNDFLIDDSCSFDFEVWDDDFEAQPQGEPIKASECPIFEQLSTIFGDSETNGKYGKYAQSSHYEELEKPLISELDKSIPSTNDLLVNSNANGVDLHAYPLASSMIATPCFKLAQNAGKSVPDKKRKRSPEKVSVPPLANRDRDSNEIMAKAMLDMLNASTFRRSSKAKQEDKFTISKCIEVLDEVEAGEGMESNIYFTALDLFEDPNMREMFVSLKSNKIRLAWLRGKCGNTTRFSIS